MTRVPSGITLARLTVLVVTAHVLVGLAHGVTHVAVPVPLAPWQEAFVLVVATLGPIVALALVLRGRVRSGGGLLAVTGALALAFGIAHHYVLSNPDHVSQIPAGVWQIPFQYTAGLVALTDALCLLVGVWLVRSTRRSPGESTHDSNCGSQSDTTGRAHSGAGSTSSDSDSSQ